VDVDLLRGSPIGQVVPISGVDQGTGERYEHSAYMPDPLPDTVSLATPTWLLVARAEAALGRLDEASRHVPEPALLRRPALRREAQSTSALEGTYAALEAVLAPEVEERDTLAPEIRETLNYVVAAEAGFRSVAENPLTLIGLGELQRLLVHGTSGEHSDAGGLRDRQVVIGAPGARIVEARFVPPPPGDQLRGGVEQWLAWVGNRGHQLSPVVRAALAHYQFETLHPFSDGNGRIGRLLIVLQLMREGVLSEPILVVSPSFEARRAEYQDGLLDLSATGNWDAWVGFFARGVAAGADATRRSIEDLLAWRDEAITNVRRARTSGVAERLAGELIGAPILTASQVARRHGVTHQGAMNALRRLAELGLLDETEQRGRRVFVARAVIRILTR
jgi:cell filamentation protein, protein adenylyltransferase